MRLLDTNIFIRAITYDEPHMAEVARALFGRLERNEEQAVVLEAVVAEVVFVLTSRNLYDLSRDEVWSSLRYILASPGIMLENGTRSLRALDLFAERRQLSFVDALIVVAALEETPAEVYSFDRGLDRVPGVIRVEPSLQA